MKQVEEKLLKKVNSTQKDKKMQRKVSYEHGNQEMKGL